MAAMEAAPSGVSGVVDVDGVVLVVEVVSQEGKMEPFTIMAVAPSLPDFILFGINCQLSSLASYR